MSTVPCNFPEMGIIAAFFRFLIFPSVHVLHPELSKSELPAHPDPSPPWGNRGELGNLNCICQLSFNYILIFKLKKD